MLLHKKYISVFLLLFFMGTAVNAQQKTCVFVHGAWGGSWSFKKVDAILTGKGYTVYRPSLTGQGERAHLSSPDIDLNTHILDVVNTILFEDLHDVVLIGHSYGGMVITGVADRIPDRIAKLVYLDAFVPNDGENVITARTDGKIGPEKDSKNGFVVPDWIRGDEPLPHDVPQPLKTFTTPVSRKDKKAMALPATYVLTVDKGSRPEDDMFYFFANRARERSWKVLTMEADHNPQMTKPDELVDLLIPIILH